MLWRVSITGKPDQIYKIRAKFSGEAKFELSANEQTEDNQAKGWERNVAVGREQGCKDLELKSGVAAGKQARRKDKDQEVWGEAGDTIHAQSHSPH